MAQHALLVGIDRYPGFPAHNQLASCVADARLMADVLCRGFGFPEGNINLLRDERATRRGILSALEGLACWVQSDDIVVFYYSGHGSESRDLEREGSPASQGPDEPVAWEQTLVPYDSGRDDRLPVRDIRDDELYEWILRVNHVTPFVTVILDSCHAGTAVRTQDRSLVHSKGLPGTQRWRSTTSQTPATSRRRRDVGTAGWRISERYTLLAACRHTETAKEYPVPASGELRHGAFTWFLARELRRLAPGTSYRDLMTAVRSGVSAVYPTQTPQVEGARDREVFGSAELTPQPFVPVEGRSGRRVTLGGGAAHGITPGSEWAVFPPATRRFDDGRALGRVRVTAVRAVTSEAMVLAASPHEPSGSEPSITVGCRASEVSRREDLTLPVRIRVEEGGADDRDRLAHLVMALSTRLRSSALLREAQPDEAPDVVAHASADQGWRLTAADGALLRRPVPLFEPGSVEGVVADLETRARFLHVEQLVDRDPSNPLRDKVGLEILRRDSEGAWHPATSAGEAEPVFREGEAVGLELLHRFDRPLYLYVLELGLTGGVTLIYPVAGASQAQEPERRVRLGVRRGEELSLSVPAEHPTGEGRQRIKLFATTRETDLGWLERQRYRDAGAGNRLERRLAAAFWGGALREDVAEADDAELWTVATRSLQVRRVPQLSQAMMRSRPSRLAR